jgi:formate dehydrogenase beta subunit
METKEMVFCSWGGQVVNNRHLPRENWQKIEKVDIPGTFAGKPLLAFMGWNGIIIKEEGANCVDIVDMTREYLEQTQGFSCGRCVPCRVGTRIMANLVKGIISGQGKEQDLEKLEKLGREIISSAKCEIGKTSPVPVLHALEHYREEFLEVIAGKRAVNPGTYRAYLTAPCTDECPVHLDVPAYVELIKERRFEESLALIRERNALPGVCGRVCFRPCEFKCRRATVDDPIRIKSLKRFAADYEINHDLEVAQPREVKPVKTAAPSRAAIVGAGPAGLACAYYLGLEGITSTIFEALPRGGGMAAFGIPAYRLPSEILAREIEIAAGGWTRIVYNTRIGTDKKFSDLWKEGYKAVFVASGSHESKEMRVKGEDQGYQGFIHGVKFLREVSLGHEVYQGKKAVVVGGGNVAIDCVRTLLRLGYRDVNLLYRRSRLEMPADAVEIADAEQEGVKFHFLTAPIRIIPENGRVKALECLRMELAEPDDSGRRRPVPIAGSEFILETDMVIPAIGQTQDLSYLQQEQGVLITRWSTVEVDRDSLMTGKPGVFSGGDCVSGPLTLIAALAAGYDAALSIEQYLQGKNPGLPWYRRKEKFFQVFSAYNKEETAAAVKGIRKSEMAALPVQTCIRNFDEVELGFTPQQAIREANRCLRCYRVALLATAGE